MDKRQKYGWSAVGVIVGTLMSIAPGCAAGQEPDFGNGGDGGGEPWGTGGSTSSGMGGAGNASSSSTTSSGSMCGTPEVCNGKDDDCNGFIDDNPTDVGGTCNTGLMGVCGVGAVECKGGSIMCVQKNTPTTETCDNLDNDCNGTVDDGNPGGGAMCNTGMPGACGVGILSCVNGAFSCTPQTQAMPEVCGDMIDNDCNGLVDDNCGGTMPCAHDPCVSGGPLKSTCSACASVICGIDNYCCTVQWDLTCVTKALDMCPGC